ncbi:MAG: ABC transporter permease subunit [Mesorhizobium sp.]|uniref:ABC transporter permease subunit n=1 Tax=Mesorhizobium sp. TaxID=1871066 RepID=UPI000FEA7668|nr:ABC transporter permease subunit [Mesorhizobium sp.]RWQ35359.1 MAG: ABC transporter permease subunit [Mesorhizobium sp.]
MSSIATITIAPGAVERRPADQTAKPDGLLARQRIEPVSTAGQRVPRWLRRLSGPVLLVLLWHVASRTGVLPGEVLAGPSTVVGSAVKLIDTGELQDAMLISLGRALAGLAVGGSIGVTLAVVAGLFRLGEDLVDATMQMLRTVPNVALIPLLIIWFGIGEAPKIALIALGTAFPLYLNVYAGIRNVDSTLVEAGRTLGLSRAAMIRHVVLPGALPSALVGLRYSLGIAWLALVFGEQINATAGIGYLMANAREMFQTDVIVVCLVVYALLGLGVDFTVRTLEKVFLAWRPAFSGT